MASTSAHVKSGWCGAFYVPVCRTSVAHVLPETVRRLGNCRNYLRVYPVHLYPAPSDEEAPRFPGPRVVPGPPESLRCPPKLPLCPVSEKRSHFV